MKSLRLPKLIKQDDWEGYEIHEVRRLLKAEDRWKEFVKWFHGKSGGVTHGGDFCVYKKDLDKFLERTGV